MEKFEIDRNTINLISAEQAWHYGILPKADDSGRKVFYCLQKSPDIQEELELILGEHVGLIEADRQELRHQLLIYYPSKNRQQEA